MLKLLRSKLKTCSERCQRELSSLGKDLESTAKIAVRDGQRTLPSKAAYYGLRTTLHWRRHKSLVDRNGVWQHMDIPCEISNPVINGIDSCWASVFNKIPERAQELRQEFVKEVEAFVNDFAVKFRQWPELQQHAMSIGMSMTRGGNVKLGEQLIEFDKAVRHQRRGYAEDVITTVQDELAAKLHSAKLCSGTGSFAERKQRVTASMPRMNLNGIANAPQTRMTAVLRNFSTASRQMVLQTSNMMKQCYEGLWDVQQEKSSRERDSKAALREVVQRELPALAAAVKRAKAALPT
eukprot:gnl/TRDRNA2_/TRDRNA2_139336_c0_seq1.p1 gnl/TRDRNA2_/TRDRNA2_139336_c0~~gnl/TRDRNA2_/TRDRNA2_139336_c0_seq1.p1  ORF type:complete len:294 (-),score=43.58 gnl/TRDRNA2_/TRDRNA2_139336_c0_seq1:27-908(-)